MILRPPISTRTDTLFPYTTLFRSDLQLWSATGAVYYDLPTAGRVSPYIGGGGGAVRESIDRVSASSGGTTVSDEGDTDTNLTAFGEVGLNIALEPAFDLVPSRSEERRVGKECGSNCRSRRPPAH